MAIISSNSCSLSDMLYYISDHSKSSPQLSGHLELSATCMNNVTPALLLGIFTFLVVEFFRLMVCHIDVYV